MSRPDPLRSWLPPLLGLVVLCTGCAAILIGTKQTVEVTSEPPGATVTVLPEKTTFVTPGEIELPRKRVYTLLFELACYAPATGYLDRRMSYVVGGFKLVPDPLHVKLERLPAPADGEPGECSAAGGAAP